MSKCSCALQSDGFEHHLVVTEQLSDEKQKKPSVDVFVFIMCLYLFALQV